MSKNKYIVLFFLAFGYLSHLPAQTIFQKGITREINSNKRPIPGVYIKFYKAVSTTSGSDGRFELAFQNHKAGDPIFMEEIRKAGFELVNPKDLQASKISNTQELGVDIILAKAGFVEAAKKEYYEISDKNLKDKFHIERKYLMAKLDDANEDQQKIAQELSVLQENLENQQKRLDELSERFARTNFDDVEPVYKKALELFKLGEVDKAISLLENANLSEKTQTIIQEQRRIEQVESELLKDKTRLAKEKQKQIAAIRLLADMYSVNFDPQKADTLYADLLQLDSTDLDILQEAADFYREQHRYAKAKMLYPKIIAHPKAESWQVANAYGHMGELETNTGDLGMALKVYQNASQKYDSLSQKYPTYTFYKSNLAVSYEKLGETHSSLGNLDSALIFFQERSRLGKVLYKDYPANVSFKNGLAISYAKLGVFYTEKLEDYPKALTYFKDAEAIWIELTRAAPTYIQFQQYLNFTRRKLWELENI
ncbi:MAG: hypothetical protein AAF696_34310, partial [Bacteroidota bacterium]